MARLASPALGRLRPPSGPGLAIAILGGAAGFFVAGYTGVLLAVTNRPIWSDTPMLSMLFVVSAASTSAALIMLLAHRSGSTTPGLDDLHRLDVSVTAIELLVLLAVIASLGPVARAWLNVWGVLLAVAAGLGMIAPLILNWRGHGLRGMKTIAVLVLIGGFLLRMVIVFSSESV